MELDEDSYNKKKRQLQEELKQLKKTKTNNEWYQRILEDGTDTGNQVREQMKH